MQAYKIDGMTCAHCVRAVTDAITSADPAATVTVDLERGEARVSGGTAAPERIVRAVTDEGYTAAPLAG